MSRPRRFEQSIQVRLQGVGRSDKAAESVFGGRQQRSIRGWTFSSTASDVSLQRLMNYLCLQSSCDRATGYQLRVVRPNGWKSVTSE